MIRSHRIAQRCPFNLSEPGETVDGEVRGGSIASGGVCPRVLAVICYENVSVCDPVVEENS